MVELNKYCRMVFLFKLINNNFNLRTFEYYCNYYYYRERF